MSRPSEPWPAAFAFHGFTPRAWPLLGAFLFLSGPNLAHAALSWARTHLDAAIHASAGPTEFRYAFRNDGDTDVTLIDVQPSCGCTTGKSAKKTYRPGESGELVVIFTPDAPDRTQRSEIKVTTSDAPERPVVLTLETVTYEVFAVSPSVVRWYLHENASAKSAFIALAPGFQADVSIVSFDREWLEVALVSDSSGYKVWAKPVSTAVPRRAEIRLRLTRADGISHPILLRAQVR
ncbi:MAG TPA: DUF1573 domain-containing protein [Opitutus sp.]|nr:DUF1573 domain-containing protein [Opitutus sp.]